MNKNISFVLFLLMGALTACTTEVTVKVTDNEKTEPVSVSVEFTGMEIYMEPDVPYSAPSRATASESSVNRIAFKVFDENGKEIYAENKIKADNTDFDHVSLPLRIGTYTFVAVAHMSRDAANKAAIITSPTEVAINENSLTPSVYTATQKVNIKGNKDQTVTMEMGKRITTTFRITPTDAFPDEIEAVELKINPNGVAKTSFRLNPSTGLALEDNCYTTHVTRKENNIESFTGRSIRLNFFLTANEQQCDVQISMMNEKGETLYTQSIQNVPFKRQTITQATGNFFTSEGMGGFIFDTTTNPDIEIPLR